MGMGARPRVKKCRRSLGLFVLHSKFDFWPKISCYLRRQSPVCIYIPLSQAARWCFSKSYMYTADEILSKQSPGPNPYSSPARHVSSSLLRSIAQRLTFSPFSLARMSVYTYMYIHNWYKKGLLLGFWGLIPGLLCINILKVYETGLPVLPSVKWPRVPAASERNSMKVNAAFSAARG